MTSNAIDRRGAEHSASLRSRPRSTDASEPLTDGSGAGGRSIGPGAHGTKRRWRRVGAVRPIGIGIVTLWLSVIVLLPLAALTVAAFDDGWAGFWEAVTAPSAIATLQVTVLVSAIVAVINAGIGTLIAWVLVRDDFRGKRFVNAIIDLPFALPTIVASIVLLSLYGPNSPINVQLNATR